MTKLGRILHIYKPSVVGAESGGSLKLLARQQELGLVRDAVPKVRKKLIKFLEFDICLSNALSYPILFIKKRDKTIKETRWQKEEYQWEGNKKEK